MKKVSAYVIYCNNNFQIQTGIAEERLQIAKNNEKWFEKQNVISSTCFTNH